jgi:hypothetical protein
VVYALRSAQLQRCPRAPSGPQYAAIATAPPAAVRLTGRLNGRIDERQQIAEFALRHRLPSWRGRIRSSSEAAPVSAPLGPRAALGPLDHLDDLGPRGLAGGEARAPARLGDAQADCSGGVVELRGAAPRALTLATLNWLE